MKTIQKLPNGTKINSDVVKSFQRAIENKENFDLDGAIIWDFVSADMCMDLMGFYNFNYIDDCMNQLALQVKHGSRKSPKPVMDGV